MRELTLGNARRSAERDADLVEALRRQETGAMEALIALYGDRVYRLAMRITGNRPDAEEVVQDAFWMVVRRIDTFRGDAAFGSWLYRITVPHAIAPTRFCARKRYGARTAAGARVARLEARPAGEAGATQKNLRGLSKPGHVTGFYPRNQSRLVSIKQESVLKDLLR